MDQAITQEFRLTRTFNAPRNLVWKAWTSPEALGRWWGPKGVTMRVINFDLRPGGMFHYAFAFQPGHEMYGRFVYREIVAPERLVFVNSFSDPAGAITRAPFPQRCMQASFSGFRRGRRLRGWLEQSTPGSTLSDCSCRRPPGES